MYPLLFYAAFAMMASWTLSNMDDSTLQVTVILGDPSLSDAVKKGGKYNEEDLETIKILKETLKNLKGISFSYIDNHQTLIRNLMEAPPAFVLNLCDEGYDNKATMELHVPAILEMLNIPYSGSPPANLAICYNKSLVRLVAQELGVPVPLEFYLNPEDQTTALPTIFPALLKPSCGDGSIGITKEAVVHNVEQLIAYRRHLRETLPTMPILVQEFLQGHEYSVTLIGNERFEVLPILEVDYGDLPAELPQILGYESKWLPDSPYWNRIKFKEANLSEESSRILIEYSLLLFKRLGCRDCARFDYRADRNGSIKFLEVNPNPGWCWDGKVSLMASFKGMNYAELLELILRTALERYRLEPSLG